MPDASLAPSLRSRWPLIGHLPRLHRDALAYLREAELEFGPVFWLDMGFNSVVLLVMGEQGFEVFRDKNLDSSNLHADYSTFLGESMLTTDGPDHRRMRGASGAAFTPSGLGRAQVGELIAETITRKLRSWDGRDELAILPETKAIALEVIFRMLGVEVHDLPQWSRWYGEYLWGAINLPIKFPGSPAWRASRARRWLEKRVLAIIEATRERGERDSIVGAMVHGRDEAGAGMSDRELIDNLLILGLAGHETTASTMAWAMLHLASAPKRWAQLVDEAMAMDEVPSDWRELGKRAPFAVGVFRESLRHYPPVSIDSRRCHTPTELGGYAIRPGQTVGTSLLHMSRDPAVYDDPDAWRPERWLEIDRKPTPVENCQFGGGAHFCLGYHMALLEGTLFLVHVARHLADAGRQPTRLGPLPKPIYLPLTHPPADASLRL